VPVKTTRFLDRVEIDSYFKEKNALAYFRNVTKALSRQRTDPIIVNRLYSMLKYLVVSDVISQTSFEEGIGKKQ